MQVVVWGHGILPILQCSFALSLVQVSLHSRQMRQLNLSRDLKINKYTNVLNASCIFCLLPVSNRSGVGLDLGVRLPGEGHELSMQSAPTRKNLFLIGNEVSES